MFDIHFIGGTQCLASEFAGARKKQDQLCRTTYIRAQVSSYVYLEHWCGRPTFRGCSRGEKGLRTGDRLWPISVGVFVSFLILFHAMGIIRACLCLNSLILLYACPSRRHGPSQSFLFLRLIRQ